MMPRGRVILFLMLWLGLGGCGDSHLRLSWEDFDQNPDRGWRPVAQQGHYAEAAGMIEDYLESRDDLEEIQRAYSLFHAGQLRALNGETERALAHMDQITLSTAPAGSPRNFPDLIAGTRHFLRGEMDGVRKAHHRAATLNSPSSREQEFLGALEFLARSDGLRYEEVYARAREQGH